MPPADPALVFRRSAPSLRYGGEFLREAIREVRRAWPLALELARRDAQASHRGSILGAAWVVLPTLAMAGLGLVFRQSRVLDAAEGQVPYPIFVLAGVVLWSAFADALHAVVLGLSAEGRLLAKSRAPFEAIAIGRLGTVAWSLGLRTVPLGLAMAAAWAPVSPAAILFPVGAAGLVALGTAAGLFLAPLNLLFRDVERLLGTATMLLMLVSPVYFSRPPAGLLSAIMGLNPLTPLISGTRELATTGATADVASWALAVAAAPLLLVLGWLWCRACLPVAMSVTAD